MHGSGLVAVCSIVCCTAYGSLALSDPTHACLKTRLWLRRSQANADLLQRCAEAADQRIADAETVEQRSVAAPFFFLFFFLFNDSDTSACAHFHDYRSQTSPDQLQRRTEEAEQRSVGAATFYFSTRLTYL